MLVIINHNNGNIIEEKRLLKYVKTHNLYPRTTSLITKETYNKLLRLLYYVSMIIEDTESFETVL